MTYVLHLSISVIKKLPIEMVFAKFARKLSKPYFLTFHGCWQTERHGVVRRSYDAGGDVTETNFQNVLTRNFCQHFAGKDGQVFFGGDPNLSQVFRV
jgi:hypothetical protein